MDAALIVIGSGISGLFVALEATRAGVAPVIVLTKGAIDESNTRWAQGGIAAAVGETDSPVEHLDDTIAAGAGLVDAEAARVLCFEAPGRIADLVAHGVTFDMESGEVALGREAAHSRPRILHVGGDQTGAGLASALAWAAGETPITILDHTLVTKLITRDGRVEGVDTIDLASGSTETFRAPAVVLATGGAGQLYRYTTNPDVATGDGIVLAFEAGAELRDLEFYQFHPTALWSGRSPAMLVSEAVRGEGAILRATDGLAFMPGYDERADLAPRDVVARAIVAEMRRTGADHVLLDCTPIAARMDFAARFPSIFAGCLRAGIDPRTDGVPVAPAAHYLMGGVRTDVQGRTTLPGLYACGEVACTGVHGANRLASNSLLETVVFGKRIVEHLASGDRSGAAPWPAPAVRAAPSRGALDREALQRLMWEAAGIERTGAEMDDGIAALSGAGMAPMAPTRHAFELQQMNTLALLMLHTARMRTESRGAHFRTDYPERDDRRWQRSIVVVAGE